MVSNQSYEVTELNRYIFVQVHTCPTQLFELGAKYHTYLLLLKDDVDKRPIKNLGGVFNIQYALTKKNS